MLVVTSLYSLNNSKISTLTSIFQTFYALINNMHVLYTNLIIHTEHLNLENCNKKSNFNPPSKELLGL